ncbi:MAG: LUD domain-containing protein [Chloroflexota bacterium]
MSATRAAILAAVRAALGRPQAAPDGSPPTSTPAAPLATPAAPLAAPLPARPAVRPPRQPGPQAQEIERLLAEVRLLSGAAEALPAAATGAALARLVSAEGVRRASVCETPLLQRLDIAGQLRTLGVELAPPTADKHTLAGCDLGVTEADFALPETGTLGLLAGERQPRAVSLLPRLHLALLTPAVLRADLHQVLAEARRQPYLVLISGPSRTADIELTVTLGVHGPKQLAVWMIIDG